MEQSKVEKVIEILETTKADISEIMGSEDPAFSLRISTVFMTLINNLKHTLTSGSPKRFESGEAKPKREPLKTVMGSRIVTGGNYYEPVITTETKQVYESDMDKFRSETESIKNSLLDRDVKEILESVDELHLLAIGKKLGLPYDRDSVQVNSEYVRNIHQRLNQEKDENELKEKLQSEALSTDDNQEGSEGSEGLGTETTKEQTDIEITEKNLDDNPELKDNGVQVGDSVQVNSDEVEESENKKEPIFPESERELLVKEYAELYGQNPHPNTKIETLRERVAEKKKETSK